MLEPDPSMAAILCFLSLLSLLSLSSSSESAAMSALSASLSPPPPDWSTTSDHCHWSGISCSNNLVTSISLPSLSLSGTLSPSLSSLSSLQTLALQHNHLSGPIPSLSTLHSLSKLYLDHNNFSSLPPDFFTNLTSLQSFSLSDNPSLSPWSLPPDLSQSSTLSDFSASNSSLIGKIPDIFGSFANLQNLRLSYNNITGSLPNSFAGSQITNLWLNNQVLGLSGNLNVLSSMTQLSQVWLHGNSFTGSIPDLSKCTNIFDLQLRDNQLTGLVPLSVMNLPKLVNVSLANNRLQGPKPVFGSNVTVNLGTINSFCRDSPGPCDPQVSVLLSVAGALGYPDKIAQSWTGNDACASWTFVACNPEKKVIVVNFVKQGFSGTISSALGNLTSLQGLHLNDNNLTGPIPSSLTTLTQLTVIDLFNNNLTGVVPVFPAKVKVNISPGNSFLDKDSALGGGGSGHGSNSTKGLKDSPPGSKGPIGFIIGVVIACACFVAILGFLSYKYYFDKCYFKKPHRDFGRVGESDMGSEVAKSNAVTSVSNGQSAAPSELRSQSSLDRREMPNFEGSNVVVSLQVIRQVTNNFSQDNVLGRGGFGVVYKGELQDGTRIAVKRMESGVMGTKGMKEFQSEIAVLKKVRHRHLVALLGSCANGSERLLVYEYMPQGTLSQHLFEWAENGYPPLTWKQRVTIALDVARGVEYLHSLAQESFIHRDLKPSNILLGDDMRAKVADFGLVKNAPDGKYSLETRLAGTFGYLAPEYAATGRVTTKVDVYAYGVVLMEIITGRKALDESLPDERSHLVTWFRRVIINKDNLHKIIDQTLDPDEETYKSICKVAELAGHCTAREPIQRPDMGHAVNVLGPMVEQWIPSYAEDEENYGIDLQMSLPQIVQRWQSDEGTSGIFNDLSYGQSHASIPSQPGSFADSFNTSDCR